MRRGLKQVAVCLLVSASFWYGSLLAGLSVPEQMDLKVQAKNFRDALDDLGDRDLAVGYLEERYPQMEQLVSIALEKMKNMCSQE